MACRGCEVACAMAHVEADDLGPAIAAGALPRIYLESADRFAVPLQCRHCEDAPCVRVCPSGALGRRDLSAPVLVDQEKCIGCTFCVEACPFGVIRVARTAANGSAETRVAVIKCDLCVARQSAGLGPACVAACPTRALALEEVDENARKSRARTAAAALVAVGVDGEPRGGLFGRV
jgi:Fe-S-cluster-containing hydrogenase component 2